METKSKKQIKVCEYCGEVFEFVRSRKRFCNEKCAKAKYRIENKERIAERDKRYREEHKDEIAERGKKYREANKDKIAERDKRYYEKNKEKILEQNKKYQEANKEKIAENKKKYYRKIYDECERGVIKETLIHLIFAFLNLHPNTELKELSLEFY